MRIALGSIHPRSLSGQIEGLVGLAQALEQAGHTTQIISAFTGKNLLSTDRLQLARHPSRIFMDQPARMTRILTRLVHTSRAVDVIQLNLPTPAFSIYTDLLQALVKIPVVVGYEAHLANARDILRHWVHSPIFYLPRLLINNHFIARLTLRRAAHYVVNTQYQHTELIALGIAPERISVIPTILPHDKLLPDSNDVTAFPNLGRRLVIYVGHYNHIKGVDVLVRAFQLLAPRYVDLHLTLAWSGLGAPQHIHKLLSDSGLINRVSEQGHVRVPDLMRASAVVVLPYRLTIGQAAQPATLLEAMAANVPVVTTNLPVLQELTNGGTTALLVPPDDPIALAAGIERVLTDANLAQAMQAAQRNWMQTIQPERLVKQYEQVYERVIASRQA